MAPTWKVMFTDASEPASLTSRPYSSSSFHLRTQHLEEQARRFGSITTRGGQTGHIVNLLGHGPPSSMFSNFTRPPYSVMIGRVCGSQVASTWPAFRPCRLAPSAWRRTAPCDVRARGRCRPESPLRRNGRSPPVRPCRFLTIAHLRGEKRATPLDLTPPGWRRGSRRGTTDVEGPHGQLGARLTNRLGSDDAHGFATPVFTSLPRQITAIALAHRP